MIKYSDTEGTNLTVHGMDTYLLRYNQTPHFEPGNIILSQSFTKIKNKHCRSPEILLYELFSLWLVEFYGQTPFIRIADIGRPMEAK